MEKKLLKLVPAPYLRHAHHWLILHGRYVCKARKPDCPTCVIRDLCEYRHKTKAAMSRQLFSPSRDEARRFFSDTWAKYRRGETLAGLEQTVLQVVLLHPEYHAILEHPERHVERDYSPEGGDINPFLHLSLHLAVAEQLSIGQPPGIAERYRRLRAAHWLGARCVARDPGVPGRDAMAGAAHRHCAG